MNDAGAVLGVAAGILQLGGYVSYGRQLLAHRVQPNAASWGMWAFSALLGCWSYAEMTADWAKCVLPVACCVACMGTFLLCLLIGRPRRVETWEFAVWGLDAALILVWFAGGVSAVAANLILQFTTALSFAPILRHVRAVPGAERPEAWLLWSGAHILQIVAVVFRWQRWEELAYPVVCLAFSLWVAAWAVRRQTPNDKFDEASHYNSLEVGG
jgi:hypothetical protein